MKKIFLLLITIYSFSFAGWTGSNMTAFNNYGKSETTMKSCTGSSSTSTIVSTYTKASYTTYQSSMDTGTMRFSISNISFKPEGREGYWLQTIQGRLLTCNVVTKSAPISDTAGLNIGAETCWVRADGTFDCVDNPSNSSGFDDNENLLCNSGYSAVGNSQCFENPSNGYYDPYGEKQCNDGYYATGSNTMTNACMNTPYVPEDNDGSCPSGWTTTTNMTTGQTTCLPPNYSNPDSGSGSTGGDSGSGSTGGDSGSGSTGGDSGSGSTGGDSGSGSTGGDSGSGSTGGDSGSGSTGGGTGTSTGGTGGDTSDTGTGESTAYTCNDGGKSITTSSGLQSCDRTCEEVGLITDSDSNCKTSSTCSEGQYQAGINYLTNTPICYDLTATDINNKLLADIKENTSLNKNSNTQLGTINTNINKSNVYLKNLDKNLSNINDDTFKDNTTSTSLKTEAESNKSLLTDIQTAYTNVTTAFSTLQTNYNDLKSFIDGKKLENNTINISSITLAKNNITVFGKTQRMDCFFNQDLNALFAPISPFITFFLNISFVYLSIKLFMNYALANRGGIV